MKTHDVAELAQTLFEEAGDALFLFDPETERIFDTNPMASRLTGFSRQQMLRFQMTYLVRSEVGGGLHRLRNAFRKTGQFHSQDGFYLRHHEEGRWVAVNLSITRLQTEPDTLGLITARDMREQREAQTQLRKKEAELRRVLASVSDCLWSAEFCPQIGQWKMLYVSPVVETITGWPAEFFMPGLERLHQIIHPDDLPRIQEAHQRMLSAQPHSEEDYRIVRPDGAIRWMRGSQQIQRGPAGALRVDCVMSDITERVEAEERLRRSEKQYRDLVETSNDLIWAVDAQGHWTFVNRKAALAIYGLEPEDMIGRSFVDFLTPSNKARDLAAFERIKAGEPVFQYETVHLRKDGLPVDLSFNAIVLKDEEGNVVGTTGTGTDITQKKKEEEALRISEQRYRLLFERNLAGVFRSSLEGRLLDCNESFARILGYESPSEILAHSALDLYMDPADRNRYLARLRENPVLTNFETRLRRKDGTPLWILENVSLLGEKNGGPLLEGTIVDINEQKRALEALRASETKYRVLIENLEQSIFLKDRDLRFVAANKNFCACLDRTEADIVGRSDYDFYPADLADKYRADDLQVMAEGRVLHTEEQNLQQGKLRTVRVIKTPVKDGNGQAMGVLGIFWDITDQVSLEEQLRQAQKMEAIGQLAGGIAHDFNNLLTVILGNLSFVLGQKSLVPDSAQEMLRNAEHAGLRAAELTQRLLGFSRRSMLRSEPVHLNRAIEETVRFLRRTIDPRIEVAVETLPDLWPIKADPGMINQVLMNLCLNARDAMPHGGTLSLATSHFVPDEQYLRLHLEAQPGEYVRLRVQDTGHGMSEEVRKRIFEPFFTTKEVGKGTGLGLAMVFGIVKQHRGWIVCASGVDQGTTFELFLPRHYGEQAHSSSPGSEVVLAGDETILLVDDEGMIRDLGQSILRRFGYNVLLAEDGQNALEQYHQHGADIDLVILDGTMPRLSGRDTLRQLAKLNPALRVLFSSGFATQQQELADFPQIVGFIQKPYRVEELAGKVREVLDMRKDGPSQITAPPGV